jgi:hypothetical protein
MLEILKVRCTSQISLSQDKMQLSGGHLLGKNKFKQNYKGYIHPVTGGLREEPKLTPLCYIPPTSSHTPALLNLTEILHGRSNHIHFLEKKQTLGDV